MKKKINSVPSQAPCQFKAYFHIIHGDFDSLKVDFQLSFEEASWTQTLSQT